MENEFFIRTNEDAAFFNETKGDAELVARLDVFEKNGQQWISIEGKCSSIFSGIANYLAARTQDRNLLCLFVVLWRHVKLVKKAQKILLTKEEC